MTVSISLHDTKDREPDSFEGLRHLSFTRKTTEETIWFQKDYSAEDLKQKEVDLAIVPIVYSFEMFNFDDISVDQVIKVDQKTLYGYKTNFA